MTGATGASRVKAGARAAELAPASEGSRVPFLDVRAINASIGSEIDAAVRRVLDSGWFVLGPEVEAFEAEWARFVGARDCLGVGNGLDALTLALRAMDVGPGDEVVVPGMTFVATWLAVTATGATPVPVDVEPDTACLDPGLLEAAITPRTRVVVPVDLYGRLARMGEIVAIARRHGLRVLEDACQAHGIRAAAGRAAEPLADAVADAAAWSFYPAKNLGALGDGGAVTSDDPALLGRVRLLRNYGSSVRYQHETIGVNSRLDELQAAVLRAKLPHLEEWNRRRSAIAAAYRRGLAGVGEGLSLPRPAEGREHVWHLFTVRHPRRDVLRAALADAGVETLIHYPTPPHLQPAYAGLGLGPGSLPVSEALARETLSLPMGPHLDEGHTARVIDAVREAVCGCCSK